MRAIAELLAPAGDPVKLRVALRYGAGAVYLSGPDVSLRAGCGGFVGKELAVATATASAAGAKVYYALNILAQQRHMDAVRRELDLLAGLDPSVDACIIADPGVLVMAQERIPHVPVHLSTQANTANAQAAAFWRDAGVKRVNLARELDTSAIRGIVRNVPDMETEVFVHGAMCMAVSGRCFMSAYANNRSANLGCCTHPCRFHYRPLQEGCVELEEATREGRPLWRVEQKNDFSAVLAAEDLCLAPFLAWFANVGVTAVKIEGRTKAPGYVAQVVDVYATALSDLAQGTFRPGLYMQELALAATRPTGTGFFLPGGRRTLWPQLPPEERRPLLARILSSAGPGAWRILVMSRWIAGRQVRILAPGLERPLLKDYGLEKATGEKLSEAHSGVECVLRCDGSHLAESVFLRAE